MFDMGFTEMMLIGIVALIVIGPERLPGVARTAGKYIGRLKRFVTSVKADVEQELRADELRDILAQQQEELNSLKDSISDAGKAIENEANVIGDSAESIAQSLDETPSEADQNDTAGTIERQKRNPQPGISPAPALQEIEQRQVN